ncbi:MAG: hypothetical protein M1837_005041 [Sclerophora amabilis]|nr:MAG: hypothetical protein M1837_005041 [Sclerophora amabilis]
MDHDASQRKHSGSKTEGAHDTRETSQVSTPAQSEPSATPGPTVPRGRRERHNVRFTLGGDPLEEDDFSPFSNPGTRDKNGIWAHYGQDPPIARVSPAHSRESSLERSVGSLKRPRRTTVDIGTSTESPEASGSDLPARPKPSATPHQSFSNDFEDITEEENSSDEKAISQLTAQERARRLARLVGSQSAPVSARTSPTLTAVNSPPRNGSPHPQAGEDGIPLLDLSTVPTVADADADADAGSGSDDDRPRARSRGTNTSEAHKLVRMHTKRTSPHRRLSRERSSALRSGQVTPVEERDPDDYVPRPREYRGGILYSLLKLYDAAGQTVGGLPGGPGPDFARTRQGSGGGGGDDTYSSGSSRTPEYPPGGSSGRSTPRTKQPKWYSNKGTSGSSSSLVGLMDSASMPATPGIPGGQPPNRAKRPPLRSQQSSSSKIGAALNKLAPPRLEDEIRITIHIAETMSRQKYLLKICKALMTFGAPTHRLEEYMKMSARVLEIDGQFLYIPGCMIVSFDDASTHTTEVKIVKVAQGVDLGKLRDTHQVYKEVVHDVIGVEEATQRLDEIIKRKQKFHPWLLVIVYGCASASVGPFAFQARLIDLPVSFILGALLGVLQLIVAPKSDLFSNVFEIAGAVLTSFLARAFGSIHGGNLFCFSALAQSSIALILPGYTVLCGALELQSKSIVAGSVRMVYAIIYSLFLGFGITVGTAIYGLMDSHATSSTHCEAPMPKYWFFFFVPLFTLCLIVINQAKWKQSPVMLLIAFAGYIVNYFSALKFPSNAQISNTLGAFAVGVLGNLYSRLRHGVAAAALLPAIFVQVPSGLAASGSLVSGVTSANQIINSSNGTSDKGGGTTVESGNVGTGQLNSTVFNVGYSMIQVAIGITVGLFLSALVVYPFGKRRSGLFSF